MAGNSQFAELQVDIALAGFEKAKGQLDSLQKSLEQADKAGSTRLGRSLAALRAVGAAAFDGIKAKAAEVSKLLFGAGGAAENLKAGFGSFATFSAASFATASASIKSFTSAASPKEFEDFEFAVFRVSLQLGRVFLPILRDATAFFNRLADTLRDLTDDQREQVEHWTRLALKITGAVTAVAGIIAVAAPLVSALLRVVSVVRVLTAVLGALMSTTGVGLVLALAGLAFAIGTAGDELGGLGGIGEKLREVFAKLGPIFDAVLKVLGAAVEPVLAVLKTLADVVTSGLMQAFNAVLPVLQECAGIISGALQSAFNTVMPALQRVFDSLKKAGESVLPALVSVATALAGVLANLAPVLGSVAEVFATVLAAVIEIQAEISSVLLNVLAELVSVAADLFNAFWKAFGDDIIATIKTVASVVKDVVEFVKDMVSALKEVGDVLDSLNPFSDSPDDKFVDKETGRDYRTDPEIGSKDRRKNPTGAGVYEGGASAGGSYNGGDYGGGSVDDDNDQKKTKGKGKGGDKKTDEGGDKYRGEIRQNPTFVGLTDYARKLQESAGGMSLEDRKTQEQLKESKRGADAAESIDKKLDGMNKDRKPDWGYGED